MADNKQWCPVSHTKQGAPAHFIFSPRARARNAHYHCILRFSGVRISLSSSVVVVSPIASVRPRRRRVHSSHDLAEPANVAIILDQQTILSVSTLFVNSGFNTQLFLPPRSLSPYFASRARHPFGGMKLWAGGTGRDSIDALLAGSYRVWLVVLAVGFVIDEIDTLGDAVERLAGYQFGSFFCGLT